MERFTWNIRPSTQGRAWSRCSSLATKLLSPRGVYPRTIHSLIPTVIHRLIHRPNMCLIRAPHAAPSRSRGWDRVSRETNTLRRRSSATTQYCPLRMFSKTGRCSTCTTRTIAETRSSTRPFQRDVQHQIYPQPRRPIQLALGLMLRYHSPNHSVSIAVGPWSTWAA